MPIQIDIISGFLGSGKTTLIKKLLQEALRGEQTVLIENEFGEIGIDGGLLRDAGVEIKEINSGCICCTLVGDFGKALKEVIRLYHPDRIIIEPSGVGKLSDVIKACQKIPDVAINMRVTTVDALKYNMYVRNFAEFFLDQLTHAKTIVLSRTQKTDPEKLRQTVSAIAAQNPSAEIITTPWEQLSGETILSVAQRTAPTSVLNEELSHLSGHVHCHDAGCACHHSHDGHDACTCHDNHGGYEHAHDHNANEVFSSWGANTPKAFTQQELLGLLARLEHGDCGNILRAKGIVPSTGDSWLQFDYVPQEPAVRMIVPDYTGRLCVIGERLNEQALAELFGV